MSTIELDRRLLEAFERNFVLTADERKSYLDQLSKEDPLLHGRLRAYLTRVDTKDVLTPLNLDLIQRNLIGEVIDGRYTIESQVGEGGMGVVYRAKDISLDRIVALKVVRSSTIDSGAQIIRFLSEKQLLARFQHPNIAQIFDSGFVDEHLPYYVMEFVEGIPITKYCDQRCLGIKARIRLFIEVCSAVQAAHQQFIVHQDIKPSNILVSDTGDIKLLDFGIASLLNPDESVGEIKRNGTAFTPAYAAPEQILRQPTGTYSDVYSLGVLLYEILVGARPYEFPENIELLEESVQKAVIVPPSKRVEKVDGLAEIPGILLAQGGATPRASENAWVVRKIRGDLDAVVLKALQKNTSERYKTADEFAQDLQRFLENRPVSAMPSGTGYRTTKFIRRNAFSLSLITGLVMLIVGFAVLHTTRLTVERNAAEKALEKTDRVVEFFVEIFKSNDPFQTSLATTPARGELTVEDALDEGAQRIQMSLNQEPDIKAEILRTIGHIYNNLGSYARAKELLQQALEIQKGSPGIMPAEIARTQKLVGIVETTYGNFNKAETLFINALKIEELVLEKESPERAVTLGNLAYLYKKIGQLIKADSLYKLSLDILNKSWGPSHYQSLTHTLGRGMLLQDMRDFEASDSLFQALLPVAKAAYGNKHMLVTRILNNQGINLSRTNRLDEALAHYQEVIAFRTEKLGRKHRQTVIALNNMAVTYERMSRYDEALLLYEEILETNLEVFGDGHPDVAVTYNNMAVVLQRLGDKSRAEDLYRKALNIRQKYFKVPHAETALSLSNLANFLRNERRFVEADSLFMQALAIRIEVFGEKHRLTAKLLLNIAQSKDKQKDYKGAKPFYSRAIDIQRALYGENDFELSRMYNNFAYMLQLASEPSQAEELYRKALGIRQSHFKKPHAELALSLSNLANFLRDEGRYVEANSFYEKALAMRIEVFGDNHLAVATLLLNYGDSKKSEQDYKTAASFYKQATAIRRVAFPDGHSSIDRANKKYEEMRARLNENEIASL